MSRACAFCARDAASGSDACLPCLRALDLEADVLQSSAFRADAAARAGRPFEWIGKVAECDGFRAAVMVPPLVSGSLASLEGLEPGSRILLDLSGLELVGRNLWAPDVVDPAPAVVGGRPGALYADCSDKSEWLPSQRAAYRELDAIVERLDHAADLAPRPLGDATSGDVRRPEDGPPARHWREIDKAKRLAAAEAAAAKSEAKARRQADKRARAEAGRPTMRSAWERRKGGDQ